MRAPSLPSVAFYPSPFSDEALSAKKVKRSSLYPNPKVGTVMRKSSSYIFVFLLAAVCAVGGLAGPLSGAARAQSVIFEEQFNGAGGWYADNGVWQIGEATVGPTGAGSCAGTVLDGNYPYQAYSRLISPQIDLPGSPQDGALWLRFDNWFYLHYADGFDYGQVLIRIGPSEPWEVLSNQFWGLSPYWSEFMADLLPYAGETVQIAFLIDDVDGGGYGHAETTGWYIDDVLILEGNFPDRSLHTFDDNYDGAWEGWYAENGCWHIGEPTYGTANPRSGRRCAATNLHGSYYYLANSRLISPPFDLPASPLDGTISLSFWAYTYLHYADGTDYGQVQIQIEGGEWEQLLTDFHYLQGCWSPSVADLSDYAGQTVRIAFRMVDVDGGGYGHAETSGWYIDDVAIREGKRWLNNVEDCEGAITGWASTEGLWQMGVPTGGPGVAHSGEQCWGTRLGGNYYLYARSTLQSTWIDLPASPPVQLKFWHWFSLSTADGADYGYVTVKHAEGDSTVAGNFTGTSGGWSQYLIDLSGFAGQSVKIGFRMVDVDGGGYGHAESSGWYIDDIEFIGLPTSVPAVPYLLTVTYSQPPLIEYIAIGEDLEQVCIYCTHDEEAIPDLSNRIAILPAGIGSYVDAEHPRIRRFYQISSVDNLGHESLILGPQITDVDEPGDIQAMPRAALHGARPNPFNPRAELHFSVSQPAHVRLEIFDLRGRLVGRLVDEPMVAGRHTVPFEDRRLASGTYLARLKVGDEVRTCKMTLAK